MRKISPLESLRLQTAEDLLVKADRLKGGNTFPGLRLFLIPGSIHEFYPGNGTSNEWNPPITLLASLAADLSQEKQVVAWIGRRCWPTLQSCTTGRRQLSQNLFLDPLSDDQRLWGILEAARSPAVRVVVADGSGLNSTSSRRLQLAAETGQAVVLLARPPSELANPSWAATRWQVRPQVSSTGHPRWDIALVRATRARQGQDASRHFECSWTYEVFCGTGALDLSPAVGHRTGAAAIQTTAAHRQPA